MKWAKIFKAETMSELEQLVGNEEVLMTMVSHLRELSEDEKIRQQCQARADYERCIVRQYNQGVRAGKQQAAQKIAVKLNISVEDAM